MAPSPMLAATLQSAVISALSNILAQAISAYQRDVPLVINYVPVFQFFLFAALNTPLNVVWQEFLESTFPATTQVVPASAADEDDEPALERHKAAGTVPAEPKLNVANTLAKTLLDQTVGAGFNTLAFGVVLGGLQAAMAHHAPQPGPLFFLAPDAVRYGAVDWAAVLGRCRAEFWSLIRAGWVFWPFVSVVNFAFVKGVQARNLVGSLAGVAWGVYISLVTAAAE